MLRCKDRAEKADKSANVTRHSPRKPSEAMLTALWQPLGQSIEFVPGLHRRSCKKVRSNVRFNRNDRRCGMSVGSGAEIRRASREDGMSVALLGSTTLPFSPVILRN